MSDTITQKILNEDGSINWGQCVVSGAFNMAMDAVLYNAIPKNQIVGEDRTKRIDEIEVEFNYNLKYDEDEFARQLSAQQKGMNELTVQEYLENRQRYIEQGQALESNAAQQTARQEAYASKVRELQKSGVSAKQAKAWLETQAALHNQIK